MIKTELVGKSPLRILEQSTHGGPGRGKLGVLCGPKGVGKTACLVHIATDQLLQDKHVIHVSFARNASHIVSWYEDIFREVARRNSLDCAMDVHDHIIRNRIVMNFRQDDLPVGRIESSIQSLADNGDFHADTLVVDGFDFSRASAEDVEEIARFAEQTGFAVWLSASTGADQSSPPSILAPYLEKISIVIGLQPHAGHVRLRILKDHDAPTVPETHLALDPHVLLICEEERA